MIINKIYGRRRFISFVIAMALLYNSFPVKAVQKTSYAEPIESEIVEAHTEKPVVESITIEESEVVMTPVVDTEPNEITMSNEDIELIALVTMAEAEGESEEGKRLVIDTILNRIDHPRWPDTAYEVIYQKSQFSSMWNGRVDRCYVSEDICQLVREELQNRTNYDVVFFTAGAYGNYGTPMFQVGNHYFCGY